LLVGLLDGTLHALDPSNGQNLWEYSTNDPLLSSHTQDNLVSAHADAPDFFPGVDGWLYHISEQDRSLEVRTAVILVCLARD
jgi:outer membrane protein assembly factor BamB